MMSDERSLRVSLALLDLHTAGSEDEYYRLLETVLRVLHGPVRFSIFTLAGEEGVFTVEHSLAVNVPRIEKPRVSSSELAAIGKWAEEGPPPGECFHVRVGMTRLPVLGWRLLRPAGCPTAVLAFHDPLPGHAGGPGDESAAESGVFAHVVTAYRKVKEREALLDLFDEANARLQAIRDISVLLQHLDLQSLLSHLIAVYTRLTDAQVGSVVLNDDPAQDVEWGLPRAVLDRIRKRDGSSLAALARERREPVLVPSYADDGTYESVPDFHIENFLAVPLISSERVLGTVNLVNTDLRKCGIATTDKAALLTMSSLAATAIENAILHRELIEKERIDTSLEIARAIQRGMYPVAAPRVPGYDISWVTRSCDEIGGDYVDCMPLAGGRVALAVGDVSGHGVGAALLMATGRADLRALLSVKEDLREVVERLNDLLAADMDEEKFMTMFFARLDPTRHEVTYVSAGHDPPLLYRARDRSVADLPSTGLPLGMLPGSPCEVGSPERLDPGDVLLLTTDGVWERRDPQGEMFGKVRLRASLAARAGGTAREIIAGVLGDIEAHGGSAVPQDDITLLLVKRVV
jgi:sigma-B regulation protein RsbU (phosphoserine phosphatase)